MSKKSERENFGPGGEVTCGWYVEVPRSLVEEFDRRFPARGAKKILTITAITYALYVTPRDIAKLYDIDPKELQRFRRDLSRNRTDPSGDEETGP